MYIYFIPPPPHTHTRRQYDIKIASLLMEVMPTREACEIAIIIVSGS